MAEVVQETVETETAAATELEENRWAVISFDRVEATNITYNDAAKLAADLDAKGVAGLCIVTAAVASRLTV